MAWQERQETTRASRPCRSCVLTGLPSTGQTSMNHRGAMACQSIAVQNQPGEIASAPGSLSSAFTGTRRHTLMATSETAGGGHQVKGRSSALGVFVSECMAPADDGPLDNAAATCFVENIAG